MPVSPEFRALIEERLSAHVALRSKPMFGGIGLYADDLFFALLDDDRLYLKADAVTQAEFENAGCAQFNPMGQPMRYWEMPTAAWDRDEEFAVWVDKAVGAAERARRPRKR